MADPEPQVTVLIPCWNAAGTIVRALASVLDEAEVDVRCVVVDDASPDGTADVVEEIAGRDPRVVLVRAPENGGASAARNLGLPLIRGEWLTFLDSDDRMMPGGLTALVQAARATDALAVIGQRVWSDGEHTWITTLYDQPDIRDPGRKSLVRNPGLLFYASGTGKLFHRSIIEGLTFEGRVLGDQPWTLRALLRARDRVEVIGDTVYEWTRPAPGERVSTITADKHASAARAADAVDVAVGALRTVCDEAALVYPDEASRQVIRVGYFDRLVRADFAGPVTRALDASDPGTGRLFTALGDFIAAAPADVVNGSAALVERVFWPPLARWDRVPGSAKAAYWRMADPLLRPGDDRNRHLGRGRVPRMAVRLVRRFRGRGGRIAAGALLWLAARRRVLVARWPRSGARSAG